MSMMFACQHCGRSDFRSARGLEQHLSHSRTCNPRHRELRARLMSQDPNYFQVPVSVSANGLPSDPTRAAPGVSDVAVLENLEPEDDFMTLDDDISFDDWCNVLFEVGGDVQ